MLKQSMHACAVNVNDVISSELGVLTSRLLCRRADVRFISRGRAGSGLVPARCYVRDRGVYARLFLIPFSVLEGRALCRQDSCGRLRDRGASANVRLVLRALGHLGWSEGSDTSLGLLGTWGAGVFVYAVSLD